MPNPVSALNKIKNMFSPLERTIIAHKMETMPSSQWAAYIKANAPKAAKKEALAIKLDELLARQPKVSKADIVKHIQDNSPKINVVEKGDMKLNAAESKELDELKSKANKYMFGDDSAALTDDEFLRYNALASRYDNSTVSGLNQKSESYFNSARKAKEKGNWSDEFFDNRQGEFYKRRADALNAQPVDGNKTKFDTYTLPGGENYKEVILSLPQKPMSFKEWHNYNMPGARNPERYREDYERYLANPDVMSSKETFKSGHYDEPNILAHLRMNDRSTAEGKRALFLEELQSDWAQQGRKEGFLTPDLHVERRAQIKAEMDALAKEATAMRERGESTVDIRQRMRQLDDALRDIPTPKGVPAGPYVGDTADWTGLGLKKAIERAVEQGHDSVAWTTGAQQAKRYDLSKDINEVHYSGSNLKAYDHDGNEVISQTGISAEDLPEYIGKDAAEKLLAQQPQGTLRSLRGQDLQVGGEGMRTYYDQIVPSTANDILKSMGVTERVKPIYMNKELQSPRAGTNYEIVDNTGRLHNTERYPEDAQKYIDQQMSNPLFVERNKGLTLSINPIEAKYKYTDPQMGFDITPEIRDYVMNQGLPAFAGGGVVKGAVNLAKKYLTPLSEKEFYKTYVAQHKDIRNVTPEDRAAAAQAILESGFNKGVNVNALPVDRGGPATDVIMKRYGNKAGDRVYLLPKEGVLEGGNGLITAEGYKPTPMQVLDISVDREPSYEAYLRNFTKEYAGGGVVKAAAKGLREMAEQYMAPKAAPAVNRIDMNYKDVTKRVPELTRAANMLETGEVTASEYDNLVNSLKPVTPYSFVPAPATYEDAMRALTKNKQPMFGKASEIPAGEQTDLRLDIPAYKDHGVWVNSIHRKDAPTVYDSVSSVKNATMIGAPDKALKVAKGGPKAPFAVIRGEWNPISQEEAVKKAQENIASGEWVQVGYDPERHGYFYDRSTMEPIAGAEEIIQIGPLVIAKNPAYAAKGEQKFAGGGVVKATAKEMSDLLKLYHGGRKFEQWNPKMIGMGEGAGRRNPLMAQGPGLYAGDTTDLAKIYLKYGGDDPALTELSVDPTNIINYYKKMPPEHLEKVKEAESRLDALGLRTSNYGLQNAWLGGRAADPQRVRDILVNSGVDGLQQYLNPYFGTEFSIFNPDIIKRVRTMDSSEYAEGGAVHMDEGGLNVRATGDYKTSDSENMSGTKYNFSTDIDILNKYGFGVTKQGEIIKLPERSYTFDDGYTVTQPARKFKRDDINELRARYTTDEGVQYGVGRQPLAKGWSGYRFDPSSQSTIGVNVSPYYKGINYTKNFAEGGKVSDPFANLSMMDKAKLLAKAAKYRVQYNKQAVEHGKYPDALSSELKKNYLDQVGNSRVNRSPLDAALNYGGGYDFGVRQDIPADVARDMGKAYQYTDYFFSPFTGPKSDAVGDYYENMAGVEAGIKERGRRATEAEIQRRSAEYGRGVSKMLPQYEEPEYAEGGAVETDDVDYDEMYEFKKDEPAFAEGGEVDYDAMYEFKDNTVGFAKGGPVLSVGRGEKLPVSKGAGLTAKGRAKYNAATGSNLKAPAPHPKTDADAGRRKSFCARMSGMPGPMKDEQGDPTRKAASLKRWNC